MSKPRGKTIPITPYRKLVVDWMYFISQVPAAAVDRVMDLAPLVAARRLCEPRPMWTSMFIKAYSIVAARTPVLRRSYMTFPWARFYEHPKNIANVNLCRRVNDEDIVLQANIRSPENRSLMELDGIVREYQERPVEEFSAYRRVVRMSRLPLVVRRLALWLTINWLGRRRCHNIGTFTITSTASHGAGVLRTYPLTPTLHYGLFDDKDRLHVRLTADHRVMDGAPAAEALFNTEQVLLGEILEEVKSLRRQPDMPRLAA